MGQPEIGSMVRQVRWLLLRLTFETDARRTETSFEKISSTVCVVDDA
jgi:hypothetical protein